MQAMTSWEEKGMEKGMEKASRSLILRLLTRKIGSVNDFCRTQINNLSIAQLEILGEDLLDFGTIADLTTWLENHG